MTDLEDALDDYNLDSDRPMCGRMTKAGLPCQRTRNSILGGCPRHNPLTEATRALPRMLDQFPDTIAELAEQATSPTVQLGVALERQRKMLERCAESDPATQPPAFPEHR